MTRVGFAYDESGSIITTDAAITLQHDNTAYGSGFVTGRGNLSSVTRYNVVNGQSTVSTAKYNSAGSLRKTIDPLGHEINIGYADSFSDLVDRNSFAYPTSVTDADNFVATSQYNFNHGGIKRMQTPAPGNQASGPIKKFAYDAKTRLEQVTIEINGNTDYSHTRFVYPDSQNRVDIYTTVQTDQGEAQSFNLFDGHGRTFATASVHPGSTGGYSAKLTLFDQLGRTIKESNPTETNVFGSYFNWAATGDDNPTNGGPGWVYTSYIYDWNNRPLTVTNTAGKSKTASYDGCGCAGGDVVTLTDEVGRRRKLYSDVLGRRFKTEVLNTDGSVYSAAVTTYNARNQITLIRQWAGLENGNGVFQDTTQTFDGYGRLASKHLPQQDAGTGKTWTYNADDTLNSVTDARGASATYIYNNGRHLVNSIQYSAPGGITATATASFAYDAAGNRTSMTDGMGTQSYSYDQLSRITSETRTFSGVAGSFTLSYAYNLAGELNSITDPTNSTINYNFDATGRLSGITGSNNLYGGVTTYASSFAYRASGRIKGLTFGNNYTMSATFDSVLRPTQFKITKAGGTEDVIKNDYTYYDDGSPKFMHDWLDQRFDRAYDYDHRSMLKEAYSGSEARDFINNTTTPGHTGPYRQTYQFDAFGNMTRRDGRFWSQTDVFIASYTNHRRTDAGYVYDADGNLLQDPDVTYGFDAAGNNISLNNPAQGVAFTTSFDGDGQMLKKVETSFGTTVSTTLYLRSSVLGGRVVTELDAQGQKQVGYVFAGSEVLARQVNGIVAWQHLDPLTGSRVDSNSDGTFDRISQLDPMGVDVGFFDPFIFLEPPLRPSEDLTPLFLVGDGIPDGRCTLDGIAIACNWAFDLMDRGVAVQCPNNDCGPRVMQTFDRNGNFLGNVLSQPFQAFADGFSGFLPPGAQYQGYGTWVIPGPSPSSAPSLKQHAPGPGSGGRDNRNPDNIGDDEGGGGDVFGQIGQTQQTPRFDAGLGEPPPVPRRPEVNEGINEALRALRENTLCRALFGGTNPTDLINLYAANSLINSGDSYRVARNGGGYDERSFESGDVGAVTNYAAGSYPNSSGGRISANPITVNNNGFFFSGRNTHGVLVNTLQNSGLFGLSLRQIRGAVIIHEFLHVASRIPGDHNNPEQSQKNTELVQKFCFPNRPVTTTNGPLAQL